MADNVIEAILRERIVVIVRGVKKEDLIPFAEAVYKGGIRLIECTFDATGAVSDEETAANIKMLSEHFGDKMLIGAGTVLNEKQVVLTKEAGGKFIISPDVNEDVIRKTKSEGLVSMPGALTPSEATMADRAGADFVKLFPIASMGGTYLKNIKAPLSHIKFMAVGGINLGNMREFTEAGACGFGISSDIANKKLISEGRFDLIEERAKSYIDLIKELYK